MNKEHHYSINVEWTGNKGNGTSAYNAYERSHSVSAQDKVTIQASSDPAFRGDKTKYNPEEFLLSAIATCHMLWFLHVCADNGIIVTNYIDNPKGVMVENTGGGGHFVDVCLYPEVTVISESDISKLDAMHEKANGFCFISNSLNFKVRHIGKGISQSTES